MTLTRQRLAISGGPPAKTSLPLAMYPGGMAMDEEEEQAVVDVIRRKRLYRYYGIADGASRTAQFEDAFARHVGATYARAVSSGTAALICALVGAGVGPGDEVIVPAYTWISSASAVVMVGAIPIIAEVDASLTLDPADAERKVTPLTRAIMPVHMRGAPAAVDQVVALARARNLVVVEDVAQAIGGSYLGRRLGTIGDVGAFSLQFNKIITTGEGGMVITNDRDAWLRASTFHDPNSTGPGRDASPEEVPHFPGQNYRASEFVGAVGLVQLRRLEGLLARMRDRKRRIKAGIVDIDGLRFRHIHDVIGDTGTSVVMYLPTPELARTFGRALSAENVPARPLYEPEQTDYHVYAFWNEILQTSSSTAANYPWAPVYYRGEIRYARDMCPGTLDLLSRAIHVDVHPMLSDDDVDQTIAAIRKVASALL